MNGNPETDIERNRSRCICGPCPSYNECMRAEGALVFCLAGKIEHCTFGLKGCTCPVCPVWREQGLTKAYYCIRGTEAGQAVQPHGK